VGGGGWLRLAAPGKVNGSRRGGGATAVSDSLDVEPRFEYTVHRQVLG
jgi:hypothetical protein